MKNRTKRCIVSFIPSKKRIGGKDFAIYSFYLIFAYTFVGSFFTEINNLYPPTQLLRRASQEKKPQVPKSENTDQ